MFYVEQFGELYGPLNIESAVNLCGYLNFLMPQTAKVKTSDGKDCQ